MRIFLIGSAQFSTIFLELEKKFTLEGNLVELPSPWDGIINKQEYSSVQWENVMTIAYRKIERAELIYVINKGGYIGKHTDLEIFHALSKGKKVNFYTESDVPRQYLIPNFIKCDEYFKILNENIQLSRKITEYIESISDFSYPHNCLKTNHPNKEFIINRLIWHDKRFHLIFFIRDHKGSVEDISHIYKFLKKQSEISLELIILEKLSLATKKMLQNIPENLINSSFTL